MRGEVEGELDSVAGVGEPSDVATPMVAGGGGGTVGGVCTMLPTYPGVVVDVLAPSNSPASQWACSRSVSCSLGSMTQVGMASCASTPLVVAGSCCVDGIDDAGRWKLGN